MAFPSYGWCALLLVDVVPVKLWNSWNNVPSPLQLTMIPSSPAALHSSRDKASPMRFRTSQYSTRPFQNQPHK
jgi:hypothetical protein